MNVYAAAALRREIPLPGDVQGMLRNVGRRSTRQRIAVANLQL